MSDYQKKLRQLAKQELQRRKLLPGILSVCFDKQKNFINDPGKRKALFVARRSGKSFTLATYMILCAMKNPRVKVLYIGLTKVSAENAMWSQTIEYICKHFKIEYKYNKNTKTVSFQNGSTIRLTGADASPQEMDRLLGGKYYMVAVDECQSYGQDLKRMITEYLAPAVADYTTKGGGIICMAGTPGLKMGDHYWYRVTRSLDPEPGWSVHHWNCLDNPHMKEEILETWADMAIHEGEHFKESDSFRRQWLCEWVIDTKSKVYKFDPARNILLEKLPADEKHSATRAREIQLDRECQLIHSLRSVDSKWKYILGVDLGYEDACAFVVGAYSNFDRNFYLVESFKQNHIVIDTIAGIIQELRGKYKFRSMVIDAGGGGKLVSETLRQRYALPFKPAEKTEKEAMIATMNSDFQTENVKVVGSSNQELIDEWNELVVDEKKQRQGVFKEADKFQNHLADAALYCYREARHYTAREEPTPHNDLAEHILERKQKLSQPNKPWWMEQREKLENAAIIQRYRDGKK